MSTDVKKKEFQSFFYLRNTQYTDRSYWLQDRRWLI